MGWGSPSMGRGAPMGDVLYILIASSSGCRRQAILRHQWGGSAVVQANAFRVRLPARHAPFAFRFCSWCFLLAIWGCRSHGLHRACVWAAYREVWNGFEPRQENDRGAYRSPCRDVVGTGYFSEKEHDPFCMLLPAIASEGCRRTWILRPLNDPFGEHAMPASCSFCFS